MKDTNTRSVALFVMGLIALAALLLMPDFINAEPMEPALPRTVEDFEDQAVQYSEWTPIGVCVENVGVVVPGEAELKYERWIYATWAKTMRQGDPRIQGDNIKGIGVQYEAQYGLMNFEAVKWVKRFTGTGNLSNVVVIVHSIDKISHLDEDYHKMVGGAAFYDDGTTIEHLGDVLLPDPNTPIAVFTDEVMYNLHFWGMCPKAKLPMITWGYPAYPVPASVSEAPAQVQVETVEK